MANDIRQYTDKIIEAVENEELDSSYILSEILQYLSESVVTDFYFDIGLDIELGEEGQREDYLDPFNEKIDK